MFLLFAACVALFDNGHIDSTCEDVGACDTAITDTSVIVEEPVQGDSASIEDTAESEIPFEPNRYHVRFYARLFGGKVYSDSAWPPLVEIHVFSQAEGDDFNPQSSCVLSLSSSLWSTVNVMPEAWVGMRPTQPQWSTSGRCMEMEPEDLASLMTSFEQFSLFFAFGPLSPEIADAANRLPNPVPEPQLAGFYMKIVDGPDDLLISPGAVRGWSSTQEETPDLNNPLLLENSETAPDGFYESIPLTHHALP